jgi:hypothetical protein
LRRDRNHPSIILWSIGNEVGEQSRPTNFWIGAELTAIAHQEDPTRPTTSANSDVKSGYNGFGTNEDVFGYNYKPWEYGKFRAANPDQPLFGSETASCISSRGEYSFPRHYEQVRRHDTVEFPDEFLRPLCAALGDAAGTGIHGAGHLSVRRGRICLDRF